MEVRIKAPAMIAYVAHGKIHRTRTFMPSRNVAISAGETATTRSFQSNPARISVKLSGSSIPVETGLKASPPLFHEPPHHACDSLVTSMPEGRDGADFLESVTIWTSACSPKRNEPSGGVNATSTSSSSVTRSLCRPMRATWPGNCSPGAERNVMIAFLPTLIPLNSDSSTFALTQMMAGSARVKIA